MAFRDLAARDPADPQRRVRSHPRTEDHHRSPRRRPRLSPAPDRHPAQSSGRAAQADHPIPDREHLVHDERLLLRRPVRAHPRHVRDDRVLFSVDYPSRTTTRRESGFDHLDLPSAVREKMAHGTADQLLRLQCPTPESGKRRSRQTLFAHATSIYSCFSKHYCSIPRTEHHGQGQTTGTSSRSVPSARPSPAWRAQRPAGGRRDGDQRHPHPCHAAGDQRRARCTPGSGDSPELPPVFHFNINIEVWGPDSDVSGFGWGALADPDDQAQPARVDATQRIYTQRGSVEGDVVRLQGRMLFSYIPGRRGADRHRSQPGRATSASTPATPLPPGLSKARRRDAHLMTQAHQVGAQATAASTRSRLVTASSLIQAAMAPAKP